MDILEQLNSEGGSTIAKPNHQPGLEELAEQRLRRQSYPGLSNITCTCHNGIIVLRGFLPTYYLKQMALAAVQGLPELRGIVDEIEVKNPR